MNNNRAFVRLITLYQIRVIISPQGFTTIENKLPKVSIIGDSIFIVYYTFVKKALLNKFDISRHILINGRFENCAGNSKGVENKSRWQGESSMVLFISALDFLI